MKANPLVHGLSDVALSGAIRDLTLSGQWPDRRRMLEAEQTRRASKRRGKDLIPANP